MLKKAVSKAAGESKPEAYPQGYVEDFDETRTKLAGFFSVLLDAAVEGERPNRRVETSAIDFNGEVGAGG